jgi:ubiquitin-like protein Pup
MAGHEHARPQRREGDDEPEPMPAPAPAAQSQDTEVDALLEEIDEVLESNAEQFVRGFVQKGGQ